MLCPCPPSPLNCNQEGTCCLRQFTIGPPTRPLPPPSPCPNPSGFPTTGPYKLLTRVLLRLRQVACARVGAATRRCPTLGREGVACKCVRAGRLPSVTRQHAAPTTPTRAPARCAASMAGSSCARGRGGRQGLAAGGAAPGSVTLRRCSPPPFFFVHVWRAHSPPPPPHTHTPPPPLLTPAHPSTLHARARMEPSHGERIVCFARCRRAAIRVFTRCTRVCGRACGAPQQGQSQRWRAQQKYQW